ncbi:MAG: SOS response-associated peptidase [Gemmatimonadetes bacterium]|nr:SOS response-associated peptidase [Gemmatimonadota bacterium]
MCGRYTIRFPDRFDARLFGVGEWPDLGPRFNIAPGQDVPLVRVGPLGREVVMARWGLVPGWAKDAGIGEKLANARGETLAEKPSFRGPWKSHRGLLPADGFYEWQKSPGVTGKQPWFIRRADDAPFALGALWETWRTPDGDALVSCTVITTEPNELMRPIHDRMPVIVPREGWTRWLGDGAARGTPPPADLVAPCPAGELRAHRVSTYVNATSRDDAPCVEPLAE